MNDSVVTYCCDEDTVTTVVPQRYQQLHNLTQFAKRPAVDIDFQDLTYTVRSARTGSKIVLKSISGCFKAGEMTAILGPSGAGKSSLLNILAGYVTTGVTGEIKTNGLPRQKKIYQKMSTYIMQEDLLQPRLTVKESMNFAADLKLGSDVLVEQKSLIVEEILTLLSLHTCRDVFVEKLSGGQRRRLSLALELVNNPPILFLDEPTTGLDVNTSRKCLELLKVLAGQGRTIICTIHQPCASDFNMFDNVYVLAKGMCTYQGSASCLVPFLSSVGLDCPKHYNPADYVMEIVNGDYGKSVNYVNILSDEIKNGRNKQEGLQRTNRLNGHPKLEKSRSLDIYVTDVRLATSGYTQFCIIIRRMFLQMSRNKCGLWLQFIHHLICSLLFVGVYQNTGDDGTRPFANVNLNLCVMVFFLYTYTMTHVLTFPSQVKLLRREYFNRWYGLKPYYIAFTLSTMPGLIFFSTIFLLPTYFATGQPLDFVRFLRFSAVSILFAAVSEGFGVAIGSAFSEIFGSVVAPISIAPLLAIAAYGFGFGTAIEPHMRFIMSLSFLRYGLSGLCLSLYTHNRPFLSCPVEHGIYCHYRDPKLLVRDLGLEGSTTEKQIGGLIFFYILYRLVAYCMLRYRLSFELPHHLMDIASKVLHYKKRQAVAE